MSQSNADPASSARSEYATRSIGFSELLFLMQTVQVGIGLINLPRIVVEEANHSGWIGVLFAGAATQLALLLIVVLLRRFRNMDLYEILRTIFGKWIGNGVGLLFALYCVFAAALVSRSYIETVQSWLFPTTSTRGFIFLLLLPIIYCATGSARVLARFGVFTFFGTAWMLLLLITPGTKIQTDYYLPIWDTTFFHMMKATWDVSASMIGFELLLVFYPYVQVKKKVLLASSIGIWTTTAIYLLVVIVSIGFFSEEQLKNTLSPTLDLYQVVELPMIQRVEHIGISTWSFLIVNTVSCYLWAAGRWLHQFRKGKWKETHCIWLFVPLVYVTAMYPKDMFMLTEFENLLSIAGAFFSVALPVLLLLLALVLRKKGQDETEKEASS